MSKTLPIVAIVGRANVGKSSFFNAVLRRREAIVAREAGTTRDSIWAKATVSTGKPNKKTRARSEKTQNVSAQQDFWLVDTAGVKDPEDDFELTIQEQIIQAAASADVIWVMIEANVPFTNEDRRVATMALKSHKPVYLIVNKRDKRPEARPDDYLGLGIKDIFLTSSTQNRGVDAVLERLARDIPKTLSAEADNRLRLAILGRPNVGKSQLFNALAKKQQAIVADRAGTTRDVNRAVVFYKGREIELMDTAGIRRSGSIQRGVERFSVLRSLSAIEQADVCLLLVDVNELSVALDQKIAGLIKEAGKGLILVVSKWDSLSEGAPGHDRIASQLATEFDFVPWAPLIFTSALTGQNVTKIYELALGIDRERQRQINTPELNRWLRAVTLSHPPAGLKNRQPKLNYIVQESNNPTNFKVYGAHTKFLHWSYVRYMERSLREKHGFTGTPVKFWFFDKSGARRHGKLPESVES